ncbi:hypothetical protein DNX69_06660 [Rhodopseudomonas palustris]|jgi:hypothetical protein|uniref:Uncharacterized protein n=1 Tax=Rhodopseudomonas palustris TaxID=1076 RepID=A0A323UMH5_RHOPL|nr:hypothetical protein [Rhodopseudomonas palustris]PZA12790.1 hypothetical protein DNX69_06660 [Rhodopseudomonas palustris]
MRSFIMAIAAVATLGVTAPAFVSQAQAQHGFARPGPAHGGWQRGHRGVRPWMGNRGHRMNSFGMGRRHGGMMQRIPGMLGRRH